MAAHDVHIGIVVPVKDEESLLPECLESLLAAVALARVSARVAVVLDSCRDGSAGVARRFAANPAAKRVAPIVVISGEFDNVGTARAAGVQQLLAGLRHPARLWLASTDADSTVPAHWLSRQVEYASAGATVVVGTVTVGDWDDRSAAARDRAESAYISGHGHRHVHGANLGMRADAYLRAGGFPALAAHEDVALVRRFLANDEHIVWAGDIAVTTSGRRGNRVPEGFASYLNRLDPPAASGNHVVELRDGASVGRPDVEQEVGLVVPGDPM